MKKTILGLIIMIAIFIGIRITTAKIDESEAPRTFDTKVYPGIEWIKGEARERENYSRHLIGSWMKIEELLELSKKGTDICGKDLWKYNFYENVADGYQRIFLIQDYDMLFELHVNWILDKPEKYSYDNDPVANLIASEVMLVANDGSNTNVDFLNGDVEGYINDHKNNPPYKTFEYSYYPIDVNGTDDTFDKFASLWEEDETYVSSNPEEITGIKIDTREELYAFVDETEYDLTYTEIAVPENVFLMIGQNLDKYKAEPKFLLYIPKGYTTHEYKVSKMEKHGEELYISVEKIPRKSNKMVKDGCLIGLQMLRDQSTAETVRDVTKIHIELVE